MSANVIQPIITLEIVKCALEHLIICDIANKTGYQSELRSCGEQIGYLTCLRDLVCRQVTSTDDFTPWAYIVEEIMMTLPRYDNVSSEEFMHTFDEIRNSVSEAIDNYLIAKFDKIGHIIDALTC